MAEESDDAGPESRPFMRPSFLAATALVAVIVLLGVVVGVRVASSDKTDISSPTQPTASKPVDTTRTPGTVGAGGSICGLKGTNDGGALTTPPSVTWDYEGSIAYPKSPEFGAGATASEGYRFCFQHSAAGAVVTTANALALPAEAAARRSWLEYFVSQGPNRGKILESLSDPTSAATGVRLKVIGFRVLSYSASKATIDMAVQASGSGQTIMGSYVYELAWQSGDWKLDSDAPAPFNFSTVPDSSGYIPWGV